MASVQEVLEEVKELRRENKKEHCEIKDMVYNTKERTAVLESKNKLLMWLFGIFLTAVAGCVVGFVA